MELNKKNKILIVEDDTNSLNVLLELLNSTDYHIFVAIDGKSAIEKASAVMPDLILMDVMLPDMNGFDTCMKIKSNESLKEITVIFITSLSETINKVKGFNAGGIDYITKPFQNDEVISRINTHIAMHKLKIDLQQSEIRYRSLMELTPAANFVVRNNKIVLLNSSALKLAGAEREMQILGKSISDLFHPDFHDKIKNRINKTLDGIAVPLTEEKIIRFDKAVCDVEVTSALINDTEGPAILIILNDITERKILENERKKNIKDLEDALSAVKQLKGMLPICMYCKKIRNDKGYWEQVEKYIAEHSDVKFSHGLCEDCYKKNYLELVEGEKD